MPYTQQMESHAASSHHTSHLDAQFHADLVWEIAVLVLRCCARSGEDIFDEGQRQEQRQLRTAKHRQREQQQISLA